MRHNIVLLASCLFFAVPAFAAPLPAAEVAERDEGISKYIVIGKYEKDEVAKRDEGIAKYIVIGKYEKDEEVAKRDEGIAKYFVIGKYEKDEK